MQPGASHLAACKQAGDAGLSGHVGSHSAAHVVLRRHDRNRLLCDVNASCQALSRNVREMVQHLRVYRNAVKNRFYRESKAKCSLHYPQNRAGKGRLNTARAVSTCHTTHVTI